MKRWGVVVCVTVGLLILLGAGLWVGNSLGDKVFWGRSGMMGGYGFPLGMRSWGGGIFMFLLWIVLIGGAVWLIAASTRSNERRLDTGERPLEILKRRYASGEISREEFEQMKELLL